VKAGASAVVGVDLLPVEPVPGAEVLQGDFTDPDVPPRLLAALGGAPDLVLSDMAPNTTGHRETDHIRITALVEAAARFAAAHLRPGGALVAKTFQGGSSAEALNALRPAFADVRHVKPKASRADSSEVYLVATGLRR
jgi:23S rRNA (uridine2552-2'-O)-methyltransferase